MVSEIREGFDFLWHNPVLQPLAIMVAVSNLANSAVVAIFVLYAVGPGPMGLDEVGYGLLITAMAAGGIVGSVIEERVERRLGRSNVLFLVVVVTGLVMLVPALTASVTLVAAGLIVMGASFMMWNIITVSLRQRITPDHLLGRMNATYRLFAWGVMPIGALLGGIVAEVHRSARGVRRGRPGQHRHALLPALPHRRGHRRRRAPRSSRPAEAPSAMPG